MTKLPDLPKYEEFFKPTLEALSMLGGSASVEELEEAIVAALGLTQEQLDLKHEKSGSPVLAYRMSWARSWLKIPRLVDNPERGVWMLTEKGRMASAFPSDELKRMVSVAYTASKLAKVAHDGGRADNSTTADIDAQQTDQLLQSLQEIHPTAFERLCQRLLRVSGFTRVEISGKSGDGGIDGVGVLRVNPISFQVVFQCKRWKGSVGSEVVRNFRGAMQGRADKDLAMTTGTFTTEARKEATRDGAPAIDLIDGETLCLLLRDHKLGVQVVEITRKENVIDDKFFAEL